MLPLVASMSVLSVREQPAALAVEDHRQRRPVLHAAAGVVPLGLGEDLHVAAAAASCRFERQQRRVADQVEDRFRLRMKLRLNCLHRNSYLYYRDIGQFSTFCLKLSYRRILKRSNALCLSR